MTLHIPFPIMRHAAIPYLWRARCSCGFTAYADERLGAQRALEEHITSETPIPDEVLNEMFDPEPGSEADRRRRES